MTRAALTIVLALTAAATLLVGRPARAEPPRASFALVVGANTSVDRDLPRLRYADDDAARYFDLFRLLGMHTYLMARLDDGTRALHPQAAAEAHDPVRRELELGVATIAAEVARAKERGLYTELLFVFAGHGGEQNGAGYLALEDDRVMARDLRERVVAKIGADRAHVVIDACSSYALAFGRGPGGERRPIDGPLETAATLAGDPRIGLLFATTSARDTHEWEAWQAGVFSHELRSGLVGAADADHDGVVGYREIAAFVERANQAIPNERFRPRVIARPPAGGEALVDLRGAQGRAVRIDGAHAGHYYIEDARGVRFADVHNAAGAYADLVRPAPPQHAYLRSADEGVEYALPEGDGFVTLASLEPREPTVRPRGAANDAFRMLFAMPFDAATVDSYRPSPPPPPAESRERARGLEPAAVVGWSAIAAGGAALGAGGYFFVRGALARGAPAGASQSDVLQRNQTIRTMNEAATWSVVGGATAIAAGAAVLVFWPRAPRAVAVSVAPGAATLGYSAVF